MIDLTLMICFGQYNVVGQIGFYSLTNLAHMRANTSSLLVVLRLSNKSIIPTGASMDWSRKLF